MPSVPDLIPARILNEHVYCPRLAYLEWVDQSFRDNDDTVEGRFHHRRADRQHGAVAAPDQQMAQGNGPSRATAVTLSSERLGLIAKIDVLEQDGGVAIPVEYKRGEPRSDAEPLWEPELVQLCAQALILRDAGYLVERAEVYFAGSRTRHAIAIDDGLVDRTITAIQTLRANVARDHPPAPLRDSPKCPRCSLVGICLPDEFNYLRGDAPRPTRRLVASDPASAPLYVTAQGARLSKRGGRVALIQDGQEVESRRLVDVSHVALYGNVGASAGLLRELFDRGIPVLWHTYGGWLSGIAIGMPPKNVDLRMRQHQAARTEAVEIARQFVVGKIRNCRTLIRRHARGAADGALTQLATLAKRAEDAGSIGTLLGIEGTAARIYFAQLGSLLTRRGGLDDTPFQRRKRRPPTDRTNALLSFLYTLLVKDTVIAAFAAGLDPYVGFLHSPRFGRPALALDLAEEFRPLVCDSTALMAINNGEVGRDDFISRAGAVSLTAAGRRKTIAAYERRMRTKLRHPLFGYRASYRRSLEIQARLLAGALVGEISGYRSLTTR